MRKYLMASAAVAAAVTAACSSAQAASYVPVPMIPGATAESVFGINDDNIVTGDYTDSQGIQHGFVGPLDGSNWTIFDFPGASGTQPRAIAADGAITGFAIVSGFATGEEFYRSPTGHLKPIKKDKQPLDGVAQGLNQFDVNVGDYSDPNGVQQGYYGTRGKYTKDFGLHIKGWLQNSPRGITGDRTVAGYFIDKNGAEHGFIQGPDVKEQIVDYPDKDALLTVLEDAQRVNNKLYVSGQWDDSSGNPHAFILNTATNDFAVLDPKDGSTFQQVWGMNAHGLAALTTSTGASYVYCPYNKKYKCPQGGAEARVRYVHVTPGRFLKYDAFGRTSRGVPSGRTVSKHGEIQ